MNLSVTRLACSLLIALLPALTASAASQSNLAKDQRWEEQIVPSLLVGEAVHLEADGQEFLALYAEPTAEPAKGAVILLHGIGVHPAWPDVIEPLRMELPEHGWHTLSLQMPILENEAESEDYAPLFGEVPARIQAGVDFLKDKGVETIVLSGHSMGATMATYYLATQKDPTIKVFAIISGGPGVAGDPKMDSLANFKEIKDTLIVDVRGSEDEEFVLKAAEQRATLAQDSPEGQYQAIEISGANHFYQGKQDELVTEISDTLDATIAP